MTEQERMESELVQHLVGVEGCELTMQHVEDAFVSGWQAALHRDGEPVAWLTRDTGDGGDYSLCRTLPYRDESGDWHTNGVWEWLEYSRDQIIRAIGRDLEPGECVAVKGFIVGDPKP